MHDAKPGPAGTAGMAGYLVSGRYRLLEPIGRGAMGVVWRGRDELLDREVAVKEVRAAALAAAENHDAYQRTLREARAAARLNHPGVITVFDVVEEDGRPWIVMELVHARSLDRLVAEDGPLRPLDAARVGGRLLSALSCAHAAGVLHRDVKPANVLLGADGAVVLTDFGIATLAGDPALTQAGMVFGTPGFTAPERIRGEPATPASDLWSLGATLYTAVEGRSPFDRPGGSVAVNAAVASEDAPRAPSAGPLGPVIGALLRADPAGRPDAAGTARLLADAAAQAEPGPAFPGIPGGYPAFADVREFPPIPPPADLPTSADLPEFLDQPALPGLRAAAGPPAAHLPAAGSVTPAGRARPRPPGRKRILVAALTTAAVAAAGLIGWTAYARLARPASDLAPAPSAGNATPAAAHGTAGSGAPGSTLSPGAGGPGNGSAASGAGSAPPAGYQWIQVTAAGSGTVAGFEIAAPAGWQLTRQGLVSYLRPPSSGGYIEISLEPFSYLRPLREAGYLQAQALRQDLYPGYRLIAIRPARLGGEPGAGWRFSWQDGAARMAVLQVLASVSTPAGTQSYDLGVSAPSAAFAGAEAVFRRVLRTFQPLT
jgi:eukaryotic-like serine/threonine-protein kinase